ncbi:MAG: class I SAM-dependent methyltransferase [Janthinobacterium lividum]
MSVDSDIKQHILRLGFISIDDLMQKALTASENSYYRHKKFIGAQGDFITSPEISQLFGEIIGLWCIESWYKLSCPKDINLVELGPGRGILMRDILRIAKLVPDFYNSLCIWLVEINSELIKQQKENLLVFNINIKWVDEIDKVSNIPTIFVANEFFDAIPIKQFIKADNTWYERVLTINSYNELQYSIINISLQQQSRLLKKYFQAPGGAIVEESIISEEILTLMAHHIEQHKGCFLIIDYGYHIEPAKRTKLQFISTLQAIKDHKYHPIFKNLGDADLSAHVDFCSLEKILLGNIINCKYTSQQKFLIENGILVRLERLKKLVPIEMFQLVKKQVDRLISPTQMGELFKVLHSS